MVIEMESRVCASFGQRPTSETLLDTHVTICRPSCGGCHRLLRMNAVVEGADVGGNCCIFALMRSRQPFDCLSGTSCTRLVEDHRKFRLERDQSDIGVVGLEEGHMVPSSSCSLKLSADFG